jgi:phospholipid/cholesterol/gamma-HCH transport system substrate-binding protein
LIARVNARAAAYGALVLVVVLAGLYGLGVIGGAGQTHMTAIFASAKGIYVGDDVRIIGVKVGRIDSIKPEGDHVRISFTIPSSRKVPAGADAVIVSPSLVASRFIQLAPVYSGGATLKDSAVIPETRTAVPEEFDDVKQQLTQLSKALGPTGTGSTGALSTFIKVANKNLGSGNAARLRDSVKSLSYVADALASGRGDLFDTVKDLDVFIKALVQNDASVHQFSQDLDSVSGTLNDDRQSLALALDTLGQAFGSMNAFLKTNGSEVSKNVRELAELSSTLAEQTKGIEQILHVAPNALGNFYNIIDPRYGAFTGVLGLGNLQAGAPGLACGLIAGLLGISPTTTGPQLTQFREQCKNVVSPFAQLLGVKDTTFPYGSLPIPGTKPPLTPGTTAPSTAPSTSKPGSLSSLLGILLPGGSK